MARIGRIPVRNIWFLFLYASELARFWGRFDAELTHDDGDLTTLAGRMLAGAVERRRGLSRGYRTREAELARVRGRIDLLATASRKLLERGRAACRFDELSVDTAGNRLVRAALTHIGARVADADLARRCRTLAGDLGRQGVTAALPHPAELARDVIGPREDEDRLMVALARLALEPALPTEEAGAAALNAPERDAVAARRLFERAVGGFYRAELDGRDGWRVRQGGRLDWQVDEASAGALPILPAMQTDIMLENPAQGRRLVIDTKFTEIVRAGWRRAPALRSAHLYQMYAYLRSQSGKDALADRAEGLLLHPAVDAGVDETVTIQGHRIRFATVDLAGTVGEIRKRLMEVPHPAKN